MNLEEIRIQIEKKTGKRINNTMLAKALDMSLPSISRKLSTQTKVKQQQIIQLESYFNVNLSTANNVNNGNVKDVNNNAFLSLLCDIITKIEECQQDNNIDLTADKKAKLIVSVYNLIKKGSLIELKKDDILDLCKLAI